MEDIYCIDGRLYRYDAVPGAMACDDVIGQCRDCMGHGCDNGHEPVLKKSDKQDVD